MLTFALHDWHDNQHKNQTYSCVLMKIGVLQICSDFANFMNGKCYLATAK